MENQNAQETLEQILAGLKSKDKQTQIAVIKELETINFSSEAIVTQLEKLALHNSTELRHTALRALSLRSSQFVISKRTVLNKSSRTMILREVDLWQKKGLLESYTAEVIKRQYDFDIETGIPARPAIEEPKEIEQDERPKPLISAPAPIAQSKSSPTEPRPSLTQILLSENRLRQPFF